MEELKNAVLKSLLGLFLLYLVIISTSLIGWVFSDDMIIDGIKYKGNLSCKEKSIENSKGYIEAAFSISNPWNPFSAKRRISIFSDPPKRMVDERIKSQGVWIKTNLGYFFMDNKNKGANENILTSAPIHLINYHLQVIVDRVEDIDACFIPQST